MIGWTLYIAFFFLIFAVWLKWGTLPKDKENNDHN